jgi:hypothetical protein
MLNIIDFCFQPVRRFYWRLSNVIRWLPTIWNDQDFDSAYMWTILQKKFEHMEKFFNSEYSYHVGSEKHAHEVWICKLLCERIIAEDYPTPWDAIWQRHLEHESWEEFIKLLNTPLSDVQSKALERGVKHKEYLKKQDKEILCKMLIKYSGSWWD